MSDLVRRLKGLWILALLTTWLALVQLPLFDEDEGEYGEVAVEMARSGDFITPTLNGQPFFEKPILAFWLEAPLVKVFGVHAWVFRLPSLLACLLWMLILGRFARRHWGPEAGALAALLCATSLGVTVSAHAAAMDGVLCLLITLAQLDLYRAWKTQDPWAERRTWLWMALGFLAKGPVAVVVPALTSFLFYGLHKEWKRWFRSAFNGWGWLIFCTLALPWYVIQYHLMGPRFIEYFLWRENLGRLTGTLQGHGGSVLYYLPVLLVIAWPHTPLLLKSLGEGWRDRASPLTQFLLLWFATVFALFSLAHTKLPHYLLIGLPPLFLLMAQHRHALKHSWSLWLPWFLMPALVISLPFILQSQARSTTNPYLRALLLQGPDIFTRGWWTGVTGLLLLCALLGFVVIRVHPIPENLSARSLALGATGVMSTLILTTILMPVAARLQQTPVRVLAQWSRQHPGPIVADDRMPSFAVYSGRATVNRPAHPGDWVFIRADHLSDLPPHVVLYAMGGLYLVQILPQ